MREIDNTQDIIDSRDVMARIEELEGERETLMGAVLSTQESLNEAQAAFEAATDDVARQNAMSKVCSIKEDLRVAKCELEDWTGDEEAEIDPSDEAVELAKLKKLAEDCEGYGDWAHGAQLISDSYFTQYAEDLASDICDMGKATDWPFRHIDWDAAAEELKQDYTRIDFDGTSYYIRD